MNVNMHIECGRAIEIKVDMIHEMMENATSCQRETAHVTIQQRGMTQGNEDTCITIGYLHTQ
jgi:hypothetical protein